LFLAGSLESCGSHMFSFTWQPPHFLHQKKKGINLVSKSKVFWNSLAKKLVPVHVWTPRWAEWTDLWVYLSQILPKPCWNKGKIQKGIQKSADKIKKVIRVADNLMYFINMETAWYHIDRQAKQIESVHNIQKRCCRWTLQRASSHVAERKEVRRTRGKIGRGEEGE